jgi:alpha-glucosidase (family GH31 glycosyl hydrolase)
MVRPLFWHAPRDYWTGTEHQGPAWLPAHPAPLETLPLFERVDGPP